MGNVSKQGLKSKVCKISEIDRDLKQSTSSMELIIVVNRLGEKKNPGYKPKPRETYQL